MRTVLIVILAATVVFLADRLVRTENQRYALLLDMCRKDTLGLIVDFGCLSAVQTRTSWFWHLYYGTTQSLPQVRL